MPNAQCPMPNAQCPMPNAQCPMPNAQCPFFLKTYTRGECATLVLWFRVELAIKLNKTANGV
ncbi:hypothetical protein [Nostoc sp.]